MTDQHLLKLDREHLWHPFTDHSDWGSETNPALFIERGEGAWLIDTEGNRYLDGNSSIWTNVHGHARPELNAAINAQLEHIAHSSFLGFSHPLAAELAAKLASLSPSQALQRVFFSDNGSTAIEAALKMAIQFRQLTGEPERTRFLAFHNAYHGDTMGASSLGGVSTFFQRFRSFGFPVDFVCSLEDLKQLPTETIKQTAAIVIEPLVQGVNQIHVWPEGMLADLRAWCDQHGVHLILDEVMTGFGRTGSLFACEQEDVVPDFLCLAKGLTGGYSPLAATLTKEEIFQAFQGPGNTFYYGHSFTAHPLGCAAALASLELFEQDNTLTALQPKITRLTELLTELERHSPYVHATRQCGFVSGIELRHPDGTTFPAEDRIGHQVCLAARSFGLLTRPILDTIVLMPPLCTTEEELEHATRAIEQAIRTVLG